MVRIHGLQRKSLLLWAYIIFAYSLILMLLSFKCLSDITNAYAFLHDFVYPFVENCTVLNLLKNSTLIVHVLKKPEMLLMLQLDAFLVWSHLICHYIIS